MILVSGTLTLDPEKVDEAVEVILKVMEDTSKEEGNVEYRFSKDLKEPGVFHFFEKWESQEALDKHFVATHMAEFMAAIGGLNVTGTSAMKYEGATESNLF